MGRINPAPVQLRSTRRQLKKLRRLLRSAYRNVPFYENLYRSCGVRNVNDIDALSLNDIPITSKTQLQSCELENRIDRRLSFDQLAIESTTGSTGSPFTMCVDARYRRRRNLRFLSALVAAGLRPWQRLMLVTDRYSTPVQRFKLWHYESAEKPIGVIYDAYMRIRPSVLYGFSTPLRLLADFASCRDLFSPQLVVTTAEMLDGKTRQLLETAFRCPVRDFYGMTEMGLVAWQSQASATYSLASNSILTEFVPDPVTDGRYKLIMTNLDLLSCPVIRYDTGDFATVRDIGTMPRIVGFEGRQIDAIVSRDGSEITPYAITDALRDVPHLRQFKVVQREMMDFRIDLVVREESRDSAVCQIQRALSQLLGSGLNLEFCFSDDLMPHGARKYRPVQSLMGHR